VSNSSEPVGAAQRCQQIRERIVALSYRARSAHLGSSLSCVEILDAMLSTSNIRQETAHNPDRDRLVFSKGHAAMALYSAFEAWGLLESRLLESYLQDGSTLWGHVTCTDAAPAIDASTGSLGHGLGLATGLALAYRLRGYGGRIFCVLSDGDCDEGSTWEAALFASHHGLNSLTAVIDYNKIQSIGRTSEVLELEPLVAKWQAFGWSVSCVDGHDYDALTSALRATDTKQPSMIIADTVKGKGIARIEHTVASHYHPATLEDL